MDGLDADTPPSSSPSNASTVPAAVDFFSRLAPGSIVLARDPANNKPLRGKAATDADATAAAASAALRKTVGHVPEAAAALALLGFSPAVVTGVSRRTGLASLCFGLEPIVDDVAVPLNELVIVGNSLSGATIAAIAHCSRIITQTAAMAATMKEDQLECAKPLNGQNQTVMATASADDSPALLDAVVAALSATARRRQRPDLLVVDSVCGGLQGLACLRRVVYCAAGASRAATSGGELRVLVVVSEPSALMTLRATVDAVSETLEGSAAAASLHLPCALAPYGAEPVRRGSGRLSARDDTTAGALTYVWCAASADVLHQLATAQGAHGKPTGTCPFGLVPSDVAAAPILVVPGDEKVTTTLAVAELEALWGVRAAHIDVAEAWSPLAPSRTEPVRLTVPLSLRQIRRVASFVENEWGTQELCGCGVAGALACGDDTGRRATAPRLMDEDARLYALQRITQYEFDQNEGSSMAVVVAPLEFYPADIVAAATGSPVVEIVVDATTTVKNVLDAAARWRDHALRCVLLLRVRADSSLLVVKVEAEFGDQDWLDTAAVRPSPSRDRRVDPLQQPVVALAVAARCRFVVSVGRPAEHVVARWLDACGRFAWPTHYAVATDADGALDECGGATGAPEAILSTTLSRVWGADLINGVSRALHARYGEEAPKRKRNRTEAAAVQQRPSRTPLTLEGCSPAQLEHPLETELRVICAAGATPPASIVALAR
jgi:hypothetical protein